MNSFKNKVVIFISVSLMLSLVVGARQAMHSDLFLAHSMEIIHSVPNPPLNKKIISQLAAVSLGKVNLFELDLKAIERKLLTNDWIKEVRLDKKQQKVLVVSVFYRVPKAIIQKPNGTLAYVDIEGKVFGSVNLLNIEDLPMISGIAEQNKLKLKDSIQLIKRWQTSPLGYLSRLSSVTWENERGFRLLVSYSLMNKRTVIEKADSSDANSKTCAFARTMVDLGQEIDDDFDSKLNRLSSVIQYLSGNYINTHQIWTDAGKKVVVKISHGS